MSETLVSCVDAGRSFGAGANATVALQPTTCAIQSGVRIALVGPSGSGKSTLLHLIAGLDQPNNGTVRWPGIDGGPKPHPGGVSVVFQGPTLLAPLTVEENVALPLVLAGERDAVAHSLARGRLKGLGLLELADRLPEEISGGQAQRVAVARALAGKASLIVADEPTGQLDQASGMLVVDALLAAAEDADAALLVATHDPAVADRLTERWTMDGGRLTSHDEREPTCHR